MNRDKYRAAFDAIEFSRDFEGETIRKLRRAAEQPTKKEQTTMSMHRMKKTAMLAAAAVALLALSVSAAVLWLTPAQVAEHLEDPVLAAAFESGGAVTLNETQTSGDYTVTLAGLVSGEGLSCYEATIGGEVQPDRTYAMFSVARADGTPLEDQPQELAYTPLVSGLPPYAVNSWTLGATVTSFVEDGSAYYILDTRNLEMFADHTVYLAIYQGSVPGPDTFVMDEDGAISYAPDYAGARILFTLPLDASRADPAAAEQFVADTGLVDHSPSV